jgi:hypothetical protein
MAMLNQGKNEGGGVKEEVARHAYAKEKKQEKERFDIYHI